MSKHKRKAKRLLKCPACGIGGFINLKAHVCKKAKTLAKRVHVEIVAPAESLEQIEKGLNEVVDLIERKSVDLLYDLVEAGLFLMKAQASHVCATVAHRSDGQFAESEDGGFRAWLEEKYPRISRRSAYNYINAAKSLGLTIADGRAAIEALRRSKALAGKTASDLYRLKDQEQPEEEESPTKWSLLRDAAVNFRSHSETVVELRPQMNKKVYSTVCARALRTLEELTGSTWDIVTVRRQGNHFKEHGDVYEIGS